MVGINELCDEIIDLNKKIAEEPVNYKNRKLKARLEIEKLEEAKKHAAFQHDLDSIVQLNTKIKQIKEKSSIDYIPIFQSQLAECKNQLLEIIIDYYNKGHDIFDIIDIENVSQGTVWMWFSLSDFGKNTGILFLEIKNDEGYNWRYSNPITGMDFSSKTLLDIKNKLAETGEELLVFNKKLAYKAHDRDLLICREIIDENLLSLNESDKNAISVLKKYLSKFSEDEMINFCTIILNNSSLINSRDLKYFLDYSDFDDAFYVNVYRRFADNKIMHLNNNIGDIGNIIVDLSVLAEYLTESQIIALSDIVSDVPFYSYSRDFINILKVNRHKISDDLYDKFIVK